MTSGFLELALALGAFIGSHAVAGLPWARRRLVTRLGERRYRIAYSLLSTGLLIWVISAGIRAPYLGLWGPWPWTTLVLIALMAPVCLLFASATLEPNPFSLSFSKTSFDPGHPGIVAGIRHPLPLAFALWSGGHLMANGDLAGLALFGSMLALSLAGPVIAKRKARHKHGEKRLRAWHREMTTTPWHHRGPRPRSWILGVLLYLLLLTLHGPVIGLDPLSMM